MIGRVYLWRGQSWRVLARWAPPGPPVTFMCEVCGHVVMIPYAAGFWSSAHVHGRVPAATGTHRRITGSPRNVLIENVDTGELTVRPFRGLRRERAVA